MAPMYHELSASEGGNGNDVMIDRHSAPSLLHGGGGGVDGGGGGASGPVTVGGPGPGPGPGAGGVVYSETGNRYYTGDNDTSGISLPSTTSSSPSSTTSIPFSSNNSPFATRRRVRAPTSRGSSWTNSLVDEYHSKQDKVRWFFEQGDGGSMVLLVLLYVLQGIPMGLTFGSIPFLLQNKVSYTDLGIFSLVGYPYSLKLIWSPIVDSMYSRKFGRRKSWIVPIQFTASILMFCISYVVESLDAPSDANTSVAAVWKLTLVFLALVTLIATQDIAVDGWALTMLSGPNVGYSSSCQTVGLNLGYFVSFTLFLALHSPEFANAHLRSEPLPHGLITLSGYLKFWAIVFAMVTILVAVFKKEESVSKNSPESNLTMRAIYLKLWTMFKRLSHLRTLILMLLVCKIGFIASDAVTALKLIEKGFRREDMAVLVLVAFPFDVGFALFAGRWARGSRPMYPWQMAYILRLVMAVMAMLLVFFFPDLSNSDEIPWGLYIVVLVTTLISSLASTIQFVAMGGFFSLIADKQIGGTYLTLLNTCSNLGGTWPKFFVLAAVDYFTEKSCVGSRPSENGDVDEFHYRYATSRCNGSALGKSCVDLGGRCVVETEGYYLVSSACILVGAFLYLFWIRKVVPRLEAKSASWSSAGSF
eukprot:TRINITY_DN14711_c0_g1_i1.p1 TRINITY_DN14711_c0_g1~~TRINITY_DN14711_c0_g1_i1.p1  ORF type:complete len:645 (+),score=92.82 TRINITY_DN14711_c0_g1_i1:352-2286(+)